MEHTNDAYVAGNVVQITPQVAGTVVSIDADDTQLVKAGQALVRLDPSDARVALQQAEAQLGQSVREVRALYAGGGALEATIKQREADLAKARDDLARRQQIAGTGAVAGEEIEHARAAFRAAETALFTAREQLGTNRVQTSGTRIETHPGVQRAAARVEETYLALARTAIPAPIGGLVARRSVQIGQRVAAGAPLMAVVPLEQVWVGANFKESQLRRMRIGQPVTVTADVYGSSVEYHRKVAGLAAGTGAAFALLPAQNASGNWIKVVQRVPVAIDALPNTTMEQRFYRSLDWNAYLICLMWGPATLLVYPSITEVAQAVTYALCAVGSMSVGSMYLLPAAHRGYWALTATHIATFLIASLFIESSRSWATALLLVAYGAAVYRISDQVRRTADKLLKTHQLSNRLRSQAVQREREMLLEAATAARSAQVTEAERQQLFMAKVGHEIRTPAQIIVSDVEFLEHRLAQHPELHTTLRRLRSAADLMSHQMQGVADYARSQSWRADDHVELVRLPTLINDVANLHARAARTKGLTVRVVAEETELAVDLGKLRQIVENLVGNAIKYTPSGEVTVCASVRNDGQETPVLHIVVADTGIGIPDDVQDRVFEPFFRATPASQRKDGLGLGLSIVKSLVTKLGGRVELQSRAGKGTMVTVTVPLVG